MKVRRIIVPCLIAALVAAALLLGKGGVHRSSAQGPADPDPTISEQAGLPDAPLQVEQEPLSPQAPSATTRYYHIRGADLYSVDGTTTVGYITGGCTYRKTGSSGPAFPVLVSPGSVLKGIRVFYVDNDAAANLTVYLVQYDDGGAATTLASATSSGASPSVRFMDSPAITEPVDLYRYSYSLVFQPGVNSSLNQLCGVKVNYEWTIFGIALPLIRR